MMNNNPNILIVENCLSIREMLAKSIRVVSPANILLAANGEKALELINSTKPVVIIINIFLPLKDGISVIGETLKIEGYRPKVYVTYEPEILSDSEVVVKKIRNLVQESVYIKFVPLNTQLEKFIEQIQI